MARKRKQEADGPEHIGGAVDEVVQGAQASAGTATASEPDIFDQEAAKREQERQADPARAARQQAPVEQPPAREPEQPASVMTPTVAAPEQGQTNGQQEKHYPPDPHNIETISLTGENDGPKMRLFRSNRERTVAIQFDEKPAEEHRNKLSEEGFRYDAPDRVWKKHLERDANWRSHADAERVFKEIGNAIREENGLGPLLEMGR